MSVQLACQLSSGVELPVTLTQGAVVPLRMAPYRIPVPHRSVLTSMHSIVPRGRVDSHAPLRSAQSAAGGRVVVVGVVVVVVGAVIRYQLWMQCSRNFSSLEGIFSLGDKVTGISRFWHANGLP